MLRTSEGEGKEEGKKKKKGGDKESIFFLFVAEFEGLDYIFPSKRFRVSTGLGVTWSR